MVALSAAALGLTALVEGLAAWASGSASVLADALHNSGDGVTTLILLGVFWIIRRPATRRYSSGYGRAEDVATLGIVLVVVASASLAALFSIEKFFAPTVYHNIPLALLAALFSVGVNWGVGAYKARSGKSIGSSALSADGVHARLDALASLGAAMGIGLAGLGLTWADPLVGLAIAAGIVVLLSGTIRTLYERMMEAVEPEILERLQSAAMGVKGVEGVHEVKARWLGRELAATMHIDCEPSLNLREANIISRNVEIAICEQVPAARVEIRIDPATKEALDHGHHWQGQHG